MTKGIVHLKISCGLLAAVALIVGCTTEDGVVDVSACATDGVAELSAMCNDSGLSVSLKNTGKKPILVDRELVFLLLIWPLTHDRVLIPSEDESIVPKLPSSSIKDRFVILNVGESVRRTIRWNQPYKEFTCGISYPDAAVSAYESYCVLPRKEDISEIEIEYGHKYGTREGLDFYLDGAQLQNDIYEGPLKIRLLLRRCINKL